MDLRSLRAHPAAAAFPIMDDEGLQGLADSIRAVGQREPVTLIGVAGEWQVLDGRNRILACGLAGVEPSHRIYDGSDPIGFVVAANLRRRHLNESQRAMIAAELKKLYEPEARERQKEHGGTAPGKKNTSGQFARSERERPRDRAAAIMNVSPRLVQRAQKVMRDGAPEVIEAVRAGVVTVNDASNAAGQSGKDEQRIALARVVSGSARTLSQAVGHGAVSNATAPVPERATAVPSMAPKFVEAERKRAAVLHFHNAGLGTYEIAEAAGIKPSTVSQVKSSLGIGDGSPAIKIRASMIKVTAMLSGMAEGIDQITTGVKAMASALDEDEVKSWIRDLLAGQSSIRRLLQALRATKVESGTAPM